MAGITAMRAAVCEAFGQPFTIEEVALAGPAADQVRVRVMACAICHSDVIFADGGWGGTLPMVLGHEAAGVVEAVGGEVGDLRRGDRVVVTLVRHCGGCQTCDGGYYASCPTPFPAGGPSPLSFRGGRAVTQGLKTAAFAEEVVVHRSQVVKVGEDVPFGAAALLACGVITGLGAVINTAKVRPGQDVVVIGTGGVGLNSVQGAALAGARRIVAVDISEEKLAAAMAFGATGRVNARETDAVEAVRALTGGRGADFVFVTVGAVPAVEQSLDMLATGGTSVLVGMPAEGVRAAFDPLRLADQSQRIIGSKMGNSPIARDIPWLAGLYGEGRLRLDELITHRYPFERINEAMDAARRGVGLRNLIEFGGETP